MVLLQIASKRDICHKIHFRVINGRYNDQFDLFSFLNLAHPQQPSHYVTLTIRVKFIIIIGEDGIISSNHNRRRGICLIRRISNIAPKAYENKRMQASQCLDSACLT